MKNLLPKRQVLFPLIIVLTFSVSYAVEIQAQKRRPLSKPAGNQARILPKIGIVINERLSVLRFEPSLVSIPLQRLSHGRELQILSEKETEGVKFFRVSATNEKIGWVQAEALILPPRKGEDERLARLIQVSEGFEQIERISIFLENFPNSALCPPILLLLGDLAEGTAQKLSLEANRRLDTSEIRASGASVRSWFLNYNGLDRYRRQGLTFLFNEKTRKFHYNGTSWREILKRFPKSNEGAEAQKRIEALKEKMEAG
jgi:hypothetical protein